MTTSTNKLEADSWSGYFDHLRALSIRSVKTSKRNALVFLPGLVFPLLLAAVFSSQFSRAVDLPGFPEVDSFLDFVLPAVILQSIAFGATQAGADMALDVENGFFDRLLTSPIHRSAIVLGRLAGSMVETVVKFVFLIGVLSLFGARIKGGLAAILMLLLAALFLAIAIGGFGIMLAFKTGSQEAVNATFPLIFVFVFVSSAFFPTSLMSGWYAAVAKANPITWIIDPLRRLIIDGWSWSDAFASVAVAAALAGLSVIVATRSLERRVATQ
ncbi:MAG: ABC transporter permease [Acidimicrobiales bacterium]